MRGTFGTGVSQRSSSSTALGMMLGVLDDLAAVVGVLARGRRRSTMSESVTVSRPAMKNRKQMSRISSRVSCSPSISAVLNRVRMSSCGSSSALVEDGVEVRVELLADVALDLLALLGLHRRSSPGRMMPSFRRRKRVELLPRQPHEAEEHRRRELLRELVGEVALAAVDELVDEVVDAMR